MLVHVCTTAHAITHTTKMFTTSGKHLSPTVPTCSGLQLRRTDPHVPSLTFTDSSLQLMWAQIVINVGTGLHLGKICLGLHAQRLTGSLLVLSTMTLQYCLSTMPHPNRSPTMGTTHWLVVQTPDPARRRSGGPWWRVMIGPDKWCRWDKLVISVRCKCGAASSPLFWRRTLAPRTCGCQLLVINRW
jgi:hypothetical protein